MERKRDSCLIAIGNDCSEVEELKLGESRGVLSDAGGSQFPVVASRLQTGQKDLQ